MNVHAHAPPQRSRLAMRILLALLAPLFFLLLFELVLRLAGYGQPTTFFIKNDSGQFTSNPQFGWRFFPPAIARAPLPLSLNTPKEKGLYRIFVLGESAAMGDPEPSFGFSRILQVMMNEAFPTQPVEVINVSMSAINSHVVRLIAMECASKEPDLFVIYMGNNEVVGPFGPGTVFQKGLNTRSKSQLRLIRASLWARTTRVGQLLHSFTQALNTDTPRFWKSMEMFSGHRIPANSPEMELVYRHYEKNLEDILTITEQSGADTLLCTVASNVKDCPPFASLHSPPHDADASNRWESAFLRGRNQLAESSAADAQISLREAAGIDGEHAELQFRLADASLALGETEQARSGYIKARDLDALRFRADSHINDLIRSCAASQPSGSRSLVDIEKLFASPTLAPAGIPGAGLFYEHVHFTFDGNYAIAAALFTNIASQLNAPHTQPHSRDACAAALAFTPWDQFRIVQLMSERMEAPPFTYQSGHTQQMTQIRGLLNGAEAAIMASLEDCVRTYSNAVKRQPSDWHLRENFAKLLEARQDFSAAAEQWRNLIALQPRYARAHDGLGLCLLSTGNEEEGIGHLDEALRLFPLDPFARLNLGSGLIRVGRTEEGFRCYREALEMSPDNSGIHYTVGTAYFNMGDLTMARTHLLKSVELDPENAQARNNLGIVLFKLGDREGAGREWREALRLRPNFKDALHNLMGLGTTARSQ